MKIEGFQCTKIGWDLTFLVFLILLVSQVLEAMNAAADGQPALSILEQALQMEPPAPCLWVNEGVQNQIVERLVNGW